MPSLPLWKELISYGSMAQQKGITIKMVDRAINGVNTAVVVVTPEPNEEKRAKKICKWRIYDKGRIISE